jgi:hypothetical protein
VLTTKWNNVLAAVNAIGRDDRHYTLMMVTNGTVLGRRHGNRGIVEINRIVLKGNIHPAFRTEETLRYVAWLKGFTVL